LIFEGNAKFKLYKINILINLQAFESLILLFS
jgi:hypothetical protein